MDKGGKVGIGFTLEIEMRERARFQLAFHPYQI